MQRTRRARKKVGEPPDAGHEAREGRRRRRFPGVGEVRLAIHQVAANLRAEGLSRQPGEGFSAHSTAKSGLDGLMKSLALELGPHGIRVNVVSPGLTLTDATSFMDEARKAASAQRVPLRRNGLPDDVAGAIVLLASDLAGFVSGAYLPASGGSLML